MSIFYTFVIYKKKIVRKRNNHISFKVKHIIWAQIILVFHFRTLERIRGRRYSE